MAIEAQPTEVAELDTGLPLVVRFRPVIELSEDEFFEFCQLNGELRIERNAKGSCCSCHRLEAVRVGEMPTSPPNW